VRRVYSAAATFIVVFCLSAFAFGQKATASKAASTPAAASSVTKIDAIELKKLIKPNGRPLLVNFWATWCDPCREEFPELVKINTDFKGKIDFITVSLDDLADMNTAVPQFLKEMKAEMPAYLLVTPDEEAAISSVSKDWSGGLPFTMLVDTDGSTAYFRQGKIKPDILRGALSKLTPSLPSPD
jgi:thiol-disulfide isomerase/thioredoxin